MVNRLALYCGLLGLQAVLLVACSNEHAPAPEPAASAKTPAAVGVTGATPTLGPCPTGTTEDGWVSFDFWSGADLAQVQLEVRCGADIEAKDDIGQTPLDIAKPAGNSAIIGLLQ